MSKTESLQCVLLELAAHDPELYSKVVDLLHGRECPMMAACDNGSAAVLRRARGLLAKSKKKLRLSRKGSEKLRDLAMKTLSRATQTDIAQRPDVARWRGGRDEKN